MGFGDWLLGSRPDYQLLPGMQDSINSVQGMNFGLGKAGKFAKKNLAALNRGDDVSNIGAFSPLRQAQAADIADIDMDYMSGANALIGAQGGDQANQLNRMRDLATERRREQGGRDMVNAMSDLRSQETNTLQNAQAMRQQGRMWQQGLLGQLRGNVYDNKRTGGALNSLIQGAGSAIGGYLSRP